MCLYWLLVILAIISANSVPLKPICCVLRNYDQAGAEARTYHGCPKCNKHIWEMEDKGNDCPIAGCTGKRRDKNV